jgi:hypothetical protein
MFRLMTYSGSRNATSSRVGDCGLSLLDWLDGIDTEE